MVETDDTNSHGGSATSARHEMGTSRAVGPRLFTTNRFSSLALMVGFMALSLAVLPDVVLSPPESSSALLPLLKSAVLGQKDPQLVAFEARLHQFHVACLVLGIASVALGVMGLVRRENRVMTVSALVVSAAALLWQYLIIGVIVAIILLVLVGTGF